nr:MT-A70 family methyltransferase [uncultured Alistipes sp.]
MIPFPKKKYEIIYADPPWSYNDTLGGNAKMGAMPYDTMTQDEINALPLKEITAKDCILFMWATMPKLQEALDTIRAWGFKYKTCAFCWVKQNPKRGGGCSLVWAGGCKATRSSASSLRRATRTA